MWVIKFLPIFLINPNIFLHIIFSQNKNFISDAWQVNIYLQCFSSPLSLFNQLLSSVINKTRWDKIVRVCFLHGRSTSVEWSHLRKFCFMFWSILVPCLRREFLSSFKVQDLYWYMYALRYPHKNKSHVLRSEERGGHGISSNGETCHWGNNLLTTDIEALVACPVALFYRNHTCWMFNLLLPSSGMKNIQSLKHQTDVTVTVTPSSSKK